MDKCLRPNKTSTVNDILVKGLTILLLQASKEMEILQHLIHYLKLYNISKEGRP